MRENAVGGRRMDEGNRYVGKLSMSINHTHLKTMHSHSIDVERMQRQSD